MGGRLRGRRTVRVIEACLGGSRARHRFMGRARWLGGPWVAAKPARDGPRRGGARAKGAAAVDVLDANQSSVQH